VLELVTSSVHGIFPKRGPFLSLTKTDLSFSLLLLVSLEFYQVIYFLQRN